MSTRICLALDLVDDAGPSPSEPAGPGMCVDTGEESGARGRSRTADTAIFSRMLYQLSYPGRARRGRERAS